MENTTEKKSKELQEEQERCFVIMPISDQEIIRKDILQRSIIRFLNRQLLLPVMNHFGWMKIKSVIQSLTKSSMRFRIVRWHFVI